MKIIGGKWRGFLLKHPAPPLSPPTQERVKKSIFDILGSALKEGRVLDLFSGSGSLGIEALSRGANEVTFVEWNPSCMKLLKENLRKLPGVHPVNCLEENVFKAIGRLFRQKRNFDIIFMDPPYLKEVTIKCLRTLSKYDILTPNTILVVRHARKERLPEECGRLSRWREVRYGETLVSFYRGKENP